MRMAMSTTPPCVQIATTPGWAATTSHRRGDTQVQPGDRLSTRVDDPIGSSSSQSGAVTLDEIVEGHPVALSPGSSSAKRSSTRISAPITGATNSAVSIARGTWLA